MVWIIHSKEVEEKQKKFLAMSSEDFDKYMCETYPVMFKERKLPMNQTCMCWGFSIGKGWYWILADLCERLRFLFKHSKNQVIFGQIKEKFGGARFYHRTEGRKSKKIDRVDEKHWSEIIENEVCKAEELCNYYCAECGENKHETISVGGWVYDLCEKCLEKDRPEAVKIWKENKALKDTMDDLVCRGTKEEVQQLKKMAKAFDSRMKKAYAKQQKEFDKAKKASKTLLNKTNKANKTSKQNGK